MKGNIKISDSDSTSEYFDIDFPLCTIIVNIAPLMENPRAAYRESDVDVKFSKIIKESFYLFFKLNAAYKSILYIPL